MPRSVGNIITPIRMSATLLTESNGDPCQRRIGCRMTLEDHRVVTRNDYAPRAGQATQAIISGEHRRHVEADREGSSRLHVLVVVAGVGCEHEPASGSADPHHLQAIG